MSETTARTPCWFGAITAARSSAWERFGATPSADRFHPNIPHFSLIEAGHFYFAENRTFLLCCCDIIHQSLSRQSRNVLFPAK